MGGWGGGGVRLSVKTAGDHKMKIVVSLTVAAENFNNLSSEDVETYVKYLEISFGTYFISLLQVDSSKAVFHLNVCRSDASF